MPKACDLKKGNIEKLFCGLRLRNGTTGRGRNNLSLLIC